MANHMPVIGWSASDGDSCRAATSLERPRVRALVRAPETAESKTERRRMMDLLWFLSGGHHDRRECLWCVVRPPIWRAGPELPTRRYPRLGGPDISEDV